jgi:hypothetical protein
MGKPSRALVNICSIRFADNLTLPGTRYYPFPYSESGIHLLLLLEIAGVLTKSLSRIAYFMTSVREGQKVKFVCMRGV